MCLKENIHVLQKLPSGTNCTVLLAVSSTLKNQPHILNKMSLKRNAHKIKFCIDFDKNVTRGSQNPNLMFPLGQ